MTAGALITPAAAALIPSAEQLESFSRKIGNALKAADIAALEAIYVLKGMPSGTRDFLRSSVEATLRSHRERGATWGGVSFQSTQEVFSQGAASCAEFYRSKTEAREINGRKYALPLPVAGFATLMFYSNMGNIVPVGINATGEVRALELLPVDKGGKEFDLLEPVAPKGLAAEEPKVTQIEQLKRAVAKALREGNTASLYSEKGCAADLLDSRSYEFAGKLREVKYDIARFTFIPKSAPRFEQLVPTAPVRRGARYYGYNLPIAGMLLVLLSSKECGDKVAAKSPVGLSPEGELKFPVEIPVLPTVGA